MQTVGDGPAFPIREGDALYVPKDTVHSTFNTTWRPLRLLVVYTPGGAEIGMDALPGARVLEPGTPPSWTRIAAESVAAGREARMSTAPDQPLMLDR